MALFNKSGQGSAELHDLTGTFYAANRYENIAVEIEAATAEVARTIGTALMKRAEQYYSSEMYSPTGTSLDDILVRMLRLPVACLAMRRYFQQNIVSHEDSGLKLKVGDDEKVPWEWMFDRDDRALQEKYYRSLDALYDFLEDNDVPEWTTSPLHEAVQEAIVHGMADFERVYPIDHSYYTYFMLLPLIVEMQEARLRPVLKERWDTMVSGENRPVLRLAQRYVILLAMATAVERWSLEVFPQAIARRFTPSYQGNRESTAATTAEMEWFVKSLQRQAADALQDMITAINQEEHPYEHYPLLPDNDKRNKFFTA